MTDRRRARVVIVGGGIAGMAAAEAIAGAHPDRFEVTVLEAKRRTGGRAGSFTDPESGSQVDYCQHVAMGCCTNLLGLLRRHGLDDLFRPYRELTFLYPGVAASRFRPSGWLPPPLHLASAFWGLRFLSRRERGEVGRGVWRLMRSDPTTLCRETAESWLRRNGQSESTVRRFWDVILVSALGERTERVSMAAAWKVIIDGFAASRGAADVWVPRVPLAELFGERLPFAIGRLGVTIRRSVAVRSIVTRDRDLVGIETGTGERIDADHLIVAVPWHAAGRLLRGTVAAGLMPSISDWGAFPASPISGVHLWFDREITDMPHAVMVGTTSQWLFRDEARGLFRDEARGKVRHDDTPGGGTSGAVIEANDNDAAKRFYYQVVISGSHDVRGSDRDALLGRVSDELRTAFPGARSAKLLRSRVVTDPQAVFSVTPAVERSRPTAETPLSWLHLAGDWVATGWPATMEGAVIGGRMAAASLLRREGMKPAAIDGGLRRGRLAKVLIRSRSSVASGGAA